jgi:ABC-type hemin transport system ATPase subunit
MAGEMAVMAQENHVEFDFEVRDMVMFGRYAKKKFLQGDSAEDKKLCEKCLKEVGLSGYEHRSYLSLSGGEKQRVLLARVLVQEHRIYPQAVRWFVEDRLSLTADGKVRVTNEPTGPAGWTVPPVEG